MDMRGANLTQSIRQRIIGVGNVSIGTASPQDVVNKINALRA